MIILLLMFNLLAEDCRCDKGMQDRDLGVNPISTSTTTEKGSEAQRR